MKPFIALLGFLTLMLYAGLALAQDAGTAVVVPPMLVPPSAPLITLAMFIPIISAALGSFGAWLKAWTPSTGFFHTTYGRSLTILIIGICAAGVQWLASGHITRTTGLNALLGAGVAWLSGLTPNGKDADVGVLGTDKTGGTVVKDPSVPGGAA